MYFVFSAVGFIFFKHAVDLRFDDLKSLDCKGVNGHGHPLVYMFEFFYNPVQNVN